MYGVMARSTVIGMALVALLYALAALAGRGF